VNKNSENVKDTVKLYKIKKQTKCVYLSYNQFKTKTLTLNSKHIL